MEKVRSILAVAIAILVCAGSVRSETTTIAVLGSDTAQRAGFPDALAAMLREAPDIKLVERDRLKQIIDEQTIGQLLTAPDARTRVGQLAAADRLVLLKLDADGLSATICDTRLGITLAKLTFDAPKDAASPVLKQLSSEIVSTIAQFKDGVKYIASVSDFVSRDLTFERSFLQSDYADVLRHAYREIPGVAVVATDEAQVIARERDVAGVEQADRIVPVFVDGEYRTERAADGGHVVRITVSVRDASRTITSSVSDPIPLDRAGPHLLSVFKEKLAPLVSEKTRTAAPDADAQFKLLIDRAKLFAEIGEFRRSVRLREAALLLKPDDDQQRVQLVREYTRTRMNSDSGLFGRGAGKTKDTAEPSIEEAVNDWTRSLVHCEYLIRNRRLSREAATDLTYNAVGTLGYVRNRGKSAQFEECETIKKDFLRETFSRIAALDVAGKDERIHLTGMLDTYHAIFELAIRRMDGPYLKRDDLDLLADLLLNRLPESMPPAYNLNFFFKHCAEGMREKKKEGFSADEYLAFLEQLMRSDRQQVRLYGRYAKFCYRAYAQGEATEALLEEARGIVTDSQQLKVDRRGYDYYLTQLRDEVVWMSMKVHPAPPEPSAPREEIKIPAPVLTVEPIALKLVSADRKETSVGPGVRWRAPGGWSAIHRFRTLGDGLDALWCSGALLLMRNPGEAQEVLADEKLNIQDVVTDGKYVWVATCHDGGIHVFDRTGQKLACIDKSLGLPPCDATGPMLHPLGPGRVLASGSFAAEYRGWIAIIEFDGTAGKVKVIHEATKVWDHKAPANPPSLDPAMCFSPEVMFEYTTPAPESKRLVFIIRDRAGPANPLVVDPVAEKVWVYPIRDWNKDCFPRCDGAAEAFLSIDGTLFIAGVEQNFQSYRLNAQTGLFDIVRKRDNWHMGGFVQGGALARVGDCIYHAGSNWRRLNVKTGEEEVLISDPRQLPNYGSGENWMIGNSSHYGLVAFNSGTLYRVKVRGQYVR